MKNKPKFTKQDVEMCRRFDVMMNFESIRPNSAWITLDAMYYFRDLARRIDQQIKLDHEHTQIKVPTSDPTGP